jgi:hypothetical protein
MPPRSIPEDTLVQVSFPPAIAARIAEVVTLTTVVEIVVASKAVMAVTAAAAAPGSDGLCTQTSKLFLMSV